jgi:uncharacterized membrane protein YphA (DoxX/SURF4 family)
MSLLKKITVPMGANANVLIRFVVGGVFLNEGILKFLEPDTLGAGRFANIGLPHPDFLGPFVGTFETVCGAMLILGLLTRLAAVPLLIVMCVSIFTIKIPILFGHSYLGFSLTKLPHYGFLSMVHEARTDFAMWFGLVFLLITGPGRWSADALITRT